MKKSFLFYIICLSTFSLQAQGYFYGWYHKQIYNQQKDLLKKESVKIITASFYSHQYRYQESEKYKSSDESIFFDSIGNIQKIIHENFYIKSTHTYAYDKLNNLESEIITNKEGKYKKYGTHHQGTITSNFPVNKRYYNYDDKNRLINKKLCNDDNECKIEQIKYFGNKVYTYYQDIHGGIEKIEVIERKDSIEQKLELNKNNEVLQKSIIFYSKDSLKLKEDCFKNDTLIYSEVNKIENNKIIQTIKSRYFKNQKTHKMDQSVDGEYFVYNSDHSFKTIKSVRTIFNDDSNLIISRYEYVYNEKGLLIEKHQYFKDKLPLTTLYEYEMW